MPNVEFAMTYPCYFLLTGSGNPESIISEGDRCLCLFTDRDLAESFYKEKYGDNFASPAVDVIAFHSAEALVNTLENWTSQLNAQGVRHLAIDATPGRAVGRAVIREFVMEIECQD